MITSLRIERFKCYLSQEIKLLPLVVLTGLNGSGKTSILHALLLARQAQSGAGIVELNGPFSLALGEAADVLTGEADPTQGIIISVQDLDQHWYSWQFGVGDLDPNRHQAYLEVVARPDKAPAPFAQRGRVFSYLCAERLGPRDVLATSSDSVREIGVGCQGEFVAQVLALLDREHISEGRWHPLHGGAGYAAQLKHQTQWWMADIVRPIEIEANWCLGTSTASLRFKSPRNRSELTRPANMGFGISYALPIVVAGLLAPTGGLLIVENPEAHLHPAGQSAIGMFLARVAADGVQVIIETHSDHVLNGVRRAIGEQRVLGGRDAIVHFFDISTMGVPEMKTLEFSESGAIKAWPKRFFDQIETDLSALARAKRGRA